MPRSRRPSRRGPRRELKPRVFVVTEGEKTEPQYILEFLRIHHAPNVEVVPTGFEPRAVVEKANKLRTAAKPNSRSRTKPCVWAVFDRDEHPRYEQAQRLAKEKAISVAVSNPCFELWAVFHYRDHAAPIDRHECQKLLEELCGGYRAKSGKLFNDPEVIRANHDGAVRRGKQSLRDRELEGDPLGNPSTSMHELMERIRTGNWG